MSLGKDQLPIRTLFESNLNKSRCQGIFVARTAGNKSRLDLVYRGKAPFHPLSECWINKIWCRIGFSSHVDGWRRTFSEIYLASRWFMTDSISGTGSKIIVRPEEAFIVIFVLILWMGAIGLFVHRWGKIRNCEPYAPKFEAELHRPSCLPMVSMDPIVVNKRMSLGPLTSIQCGGSTWNPNSMGVGRGNLANCVNRALGSDSNQRTFLYSTAYSPYSRPRLNSVFVGAHLFSPPQPPRKTKSAVDIHSLLIEAECEV